MRSIESSASERSTISLGSKYNMEYDQQSSNKYLLSNLLPTHKHLLSSHLLPPEDYDGKVSTNHYSSFKDQFSSQFKNNGEHLQRQHIYKPGNIKFMLHLIVIFASSVRFLQICLNVILEPHHPNALAAKVPISTESVDGLCCFRGLPQRTVDCQSNSELWVMSCSPLSYNNYQWGRHGNDESGNEITDRNSSGEEEF